MARLTPCQEGNAEDWFIERDGRQYIDDGSLEPDPEAVRELAEKFAEKEDPAHRDPTTRARLALRDDLKKAALIRRRQAKQDCFSCPVRPQCLAEALEGEQRHGIWGGYYPEELSKLYAEIIARSSRRAGVG